MFTRRPAFSSDSPNSNPAVLHCLPRCYISVLVKKNNLNKVSDGRHFFLAVQVGYKKKTMRTIRFSFLIIALFFINACLGQTKNEVYLKWKLQPTDSLTYQWVSQNLDTATNSNTVDFSGFLNLVLDTAKLKLPDSVKNKYPDSGKILKQRLSDPRIKGRNAGNF